MQDQGTKTALLVDAKLAAKLAAANARGENMYAGANPRTTSGGTTAGGRRAGNGIEPSGTVETL